MLNETEYNYILGRRNEVNLSSLKESLNQAENNARIRDIDLMQKESIDLITANKIKKKAEDSGYFLCPINDKNKALFTQVIDDNLEILIQKGYLTSPEYSLIMCMQPLIEFQTNAITNRETGQFMTVSDIANYLQRDRSGVSRNLRSLIKKGVLFELIDVEEIIQFNRNVSPRTLIANPELVYKGDRNKIEGTLTKLVYQFDKLEKNNILLGWKVFKKPSDKFGRLYHRKTYLKLKRKYRHI